MKKWIGLYIALLLVSLAGLSSFSGMQKAKQADVGILTEDGGYLSQVIRTLEHGYVLYQNPEQKKLQVAKVDNDEINSEPVGTVHQNGVYYFFRYGDGNKQYIGIEPLGTAQAEQEEREEETVIPVFETTGDFLAAGSGEKAIFCSVIEADGRTITEYALLHDTAEWKERQTFSIPEGHYVVCAAYEGNTLWLAREDGRVYSFNTVLKEMDHAAENTVLSSCMQNSIPEDAKAVWFVRNAIDAAGRMALPAIIVAAMLLVLIYGTSRGNHLVFQVLCCTEAVALAVLLYTGVSFLSRLSQEEVLERGVEAGYVLNEIREDQRADGTIESALFLSITEEKEGLLEDILILEADSGTVLQARNLPAGVDVEKYYGEDTGELITAVLNGRAAVMMELEYKDREIDAVAVTDWTDMDADSVLMAVLSEQGIQSSLSEDVGVLKRMLGGAIALVTIAYGVIFFFFSSRWKKFQEGLTYVATEKKPYPEMPQIPDGLQGVWAPLDSIGHSLQRLYYERNLLYRSYYRFVPKGMENLLRKPELADIEIGDRKKVQGCMVDIVLDDLKHLDDADYMNVMTRSMELMHKARKKRDGIFLSASTDLLERKVFFEQSASRALQFSVEMLHAYAEKGLLVDNDLILLLHAAEFRYGISGVDDMMTPYMYSAQESILQPYVKALAKAKVRIALTEQTLRIIGGGAYTRYIGFVSAGEMVGSLKLYECLDAYSESQRKLMMETDVMFQRALQLFYSNDFYLARNTFNEVLKLNEQDHIARWYLFHCEYHLNNPEADVAYGLFENEVMEQESDKG